MEHSIIARAVSMLHVSRTPIQSHRDRRANLRLVQGGRSEDRGRVSTGNRWRLAAVAVVAGCILSACGGGGSGGSSALSIISPAVASNEPAQPMAVSLQYFPTQQQGTVYFEAREMVGALPLTTESPYNWASIYAVTIANLQPSDVVQCIAQGEVTNNLGYNVQVDRMFATSITNQAWPQQLGPARGENVTPDMHHMTIDDSLIDTGRSGTVTYSLVMSAASTNALMGDTLTIEQGYGALRCHVTSS